MSELHRALPEAVAERTSAPPLPADQAGLGADWEAAYRENVGWVYRSVYGRVGNRADAEDITADVFTRALPRLRRTAPREQLRAYLAATARTVLADFWRRSYGLDLPMPPELADPVPAVTGESDNLQRANRLLAGLSEHYRQVLELRFLRGCSIAETAAALGITSGNVKVLQYRALRRAAELGRDELR
jgi:RNA polymerase sigma factor (sigma-70 family)